MTRGKVRFQRDQSMGVPEMGHNLRVKGFLNRKGLNLIVLKQIKGIRL
jgi:hypothetical protein